MGARLLIIEDNRANLELMTYILSAFGYTVIAAEDGRRGVEAASREHPDLIICDVQLPDIDGFEVARHMHNDPLLCSIPLVAVTALAMVGDRDRVLAAGFDGYVAKPIDPETFVRQMEVFLQPQQPTAPRYAHEAPVPSHVEYATPQHLTILAVDNHPVNLDLARGILVPSGFRVMTAGSIAEGLAVARQSACHLILSDVCMFQETGYDFLLAVRADPQLWAIPFILITSTMLDDKDRDRGLALGADRFLRRPIEPEVLLANIRECLCKKGTN